MGKKKFFSWNKSQCFCMWRNCILHILRKRTKRNVLKYSGFKWKYVKIERMDRTCFRLVMVFHYPGVVGSSKYTKGQNAMLSWIRHARFPVPELFCLCVCFSNIKIYDKLTTMQCYWNGTQPRKVMIKIYLWRILSYLCCLIFTGCCCNTNVVPFSREYVLGESFSVQEFAQLIKYLPKTFLSVSLVINVGDLLSTLIDTYFCFCHKMLQGIINSCLSLCRTLTDG